MSQERPSEDSLVEAARRIESSDERAAYLDEACGTDSRLRQRVERRLIASAADSAAPEQPASELGATMLTRVEGPDCAASLEAGLAAVFPAEAAGLDGAFSVLGGLGQTVCIALREAANDGLAPVVRPLSPEMPDRNSDGRYRLDGEIARGGMGAILKGRDTDLGRELAIKVLLDAHKDKPEVVQRFVEEAQIGGQLQHPGIAPIYELGQFADKRPFFAMKLVKGETLAKLLAGRADPGVDRGRFIGIFEQVCQTMAYAHSRGVIHRDLKPANIMVGAFGEVQVMDWGLAKVLAVGGVADEGKFRRNQTETSVVRTVRSVTGDAPERFGTVGSQTLMGSVMGTPAYMPPEQALGEIDHLDERSDVFGLGAILCEILTGKPPYVGDDGTQIYRLASRGQLDDCFARLDASGADADLIALAKRCLEREPKNRPGDAAVLAQQVAGYLESVETRLHQAELERTAQAARADAQAAQAAAEGKRAEAERQRAESETRRLEQQQRSSSKLRKLVAGLAVVALVAGLACVAALFANNRANYLAKLAGEKEKAAQASAADATASAADADSERKAAVQSQQETAEALTEVEAQKERADREAELVRQNLYYAQMHLAQQAWREHRGLSRMRGLLANWIPSDTPMDRRGWEWFYLNSLPYQNVQILTEPGQTGIGSVVAWHMPSDRLAEGSGDGTIRIWDSDRARPALVLHGPPPADLWDGSRWIAWTPDGALLAAGCGDGAVRLWNTVDARELKVLPGHESPIRTVAFNSNGSRVAVWMDDGGIRIWDVETGEVTADIVHPGGVTRGAWSPDDKLLASVHANGELTLSGTQPGHRIVTLQHPSGLNDLAWSPDSARLATVGSGDFSARVWDVASGQIVLDELSHSHIVLSVAWGPDGTRLATGSADQTVKIWNAKTGREESVLRGHSEAVTSLAWGPDARLAAGCTDGSTRIWNEIGDQEANALAAHDSRAISVSWSPNGERLATGGEDGKARVWDAFALKEIQTIDPQFGPIRALAWSPDSQQVATAGPNGPITLKVWQADDGREIFALKEEVGVVECLAWKPDGSRLAVGSQDGSIRLIDGLEVAPTIVAIQAHDGPVRSLAWSPQGDRLASSGGADDWTGDKLIKLWDPASGAELSRFEGHAGAVVNVAWSPDGGRLASASPDGLVIEWDAATGGRLATLRGHNDWVTGVAWSPDGDRLASAGLDNSIRIWDSTTGDETLVLQGDSTMFRDVAWNSDGARIAAAGEDGRIWIWDASRGFERDTTARALPYIDRQVAAGTVRVEDERSYAEAYLRAGRFGEALAVFLEDADGLVEIAGRLDVQGKQSLAQEARAAARKALERLRLAKPDEETLAAELAELLLSGREDRWKVLEPTAMESSGGAILTLQGDGSVLASGPHAAGDVYTLRADCPIERIAAIRLEALPDPSLPSHGPGRHASGNFQLSAFRVSHSAETEGSDRSPIRIASAAASFDYQAPDADVAGLADENLNKVWHVWGQLGKAHEAVLFVEGPANPISARAIVIELHHKDVGEGINLGRFRLSVSDDAEGERERLIAKKLTDPWARLAAAYRLHGDEAALSELLERHPTAADSLDDPSVDEPTR